MIDYLFAIGHHLIVFALFAVLVAELLTVQKPLETGDIRRLAALDALYGSMAVSILVLGFCRAVFAAKGWAYYSHNIFFWLKIATFAIIGLLSAPVTMKVLAWRKRQQSGDALLEASELTFVRRLIHCELALFPLLLAFAAAMARGFGAIAW